MEEKVEEKIVKSVIPIYSIGILWMIYSLVFSMHTLRNVVIAGIMCYLAYSILSDIIPHKVIKVKVKEGPADTGNSVANEYIDDGRKSAKRIRELADTLKGTSIISQVEHIDATLIKILDFILKYPEKARQLRTFMDYYLPTTIKLLENYEHLNNQKVEGENIAESLSKIEGIMVVMSEAFGKQLDSLFEDKALDINAEVNVLKDILAREGFTESGTSVKSKGVEK